MGRVGYKDLRGYLALLEQHGLLRHVTAAVDLQHEIGAITALSLDERGPGLLFENMKGHPEKRLVVNIMSTTEQSGIAFNTEETTEAIVERHPPGQGQPDPAKHRRLGRLPGSSADRRRGRPELFPTPIWHEQDGGPFIGTTAGMITDDPETGTLTAACTAAWSRQVHISPSTAGRSRGGHEADPSAVRKAAPTGC